MSAVQSLAFLFSHPGQVLARALADSSIASLVGG
jgi:hypothetical protein